MNRKIITQFICLSLITLCFMQVGCSTLEYYGQAVMGQASILMKRKSIRKILQDPEIPEDERNKLELVLQLRNFAETELKESFGGSFTSLVRLNREFVSWNVMAAPEFALEPLEFCFPIAGCVYYKGYFGEDNAREMAAEYRAEGYDVFVSGVSAYSTLGWFDDPVFGHFLDLSEVDLAALIFHEIAHQLLYLPGDTVFNESFAETLERELVRRWLQAENRAVEYNLYQDALDRQTKFVKRVERRKKVLTDLYKVEVSEEAKRALKMQQFEILLWEADGRFDARSSREKDSFDQLNNARLAAFSSYNNLVEDFQQVLQACGGYMDRYLETSRYLMGVRKKELKKGLLREDGMKVVKEFPQGWTGCYSGNE